jgi:hypothetical protein
MSKYKGFTDGTKSNDITEIMEHMRSFNTSEDTPLVGFFWYDIKNNELFGVQSIDADQTPYYKGKKTLQKTHKKYWQKEVHRSSKDPRIKGDYTMTPRGRVYQLQDKTFVVYVGRWIDKYQDKIEDLIKEEFNIDKFEFVIDSHWDIGQGWDGD